MSTRVILSIVVLKFGFLSANYLEAESNYMKPKLERNNILNKRVWIKNKSNENLSEKSSGGQYIFRSNSIALDDILQTNFDAFSDNYVQDTPFVSSYIQRSRRSPNDILKLRSRKSLKNCVNKNDCKKTNINNKGDKTKPVQSKFIPDLKPTSIFNDYPYEVAILLNNDKLKNKPNDTIAINKNNVSELFTSINDINSITKENNNHKIYSNENKSNNTTLPKRSSKYNYETENRDTIEFITTLNVTNAKDKTGRNVFDKNDIGWHQSAPIPDTNFYKVIPKEPANIKTVNEKALVKVISTLTKTFKKIMKQHDDIKTIHNKLQGINKDLLKNIANITEKFHDFDIKYINFMKLSDTIKQVESDLAQKEQMFKNKHKEMTINMIEFENQQKKFLAQQKQFYSVQQLILAQNEKINTKQNLIAKTQSEISHRQNNFARILKKAKEMYTNSKNIVIPKIDSSFAKIKNDTTNFNTKQVTYTTTSIPPSSESIKINLFSIPIASRIQNQDEVLMKEKDHHPIDDLVYKFYFNNTLIDKLMKSNVLNSIAAVAENRETRNNVKNKRNGLTTLLLPVNKPYIDFKSKVVQRNKRWISHYYRKHRKHHGKGGASIVNAKAKLNFKNNTNSIRGPNVNKTDPFLAMATNFCNEIRRNGKGQVLAWCIEKTLRRLQFMDAKLFPTFPIKPVESKTIKPSVKKDIPTASNLFTEAKQSTPAVGTDSEGYSDLLPDPTSNSKVDISPYAYQVRRHGYMM